MKIGIVNSNTNLKIKFSGATANMTQPVTVQQKSRENDIKDNKTGNNSSKLLVASACVAGAIWGGAVIYRKHKTPSVKDIGNSISKITEKLKNGSEINSNIINIDDNHYFEDPMSKLMKEVEQKLDVSYEHSWIPPEAERKTEKLDIDKFYSYKEYPLHEEAVSAHPVFNLPSSDSVGNTGFSAEVPAYNTIVPTISPNSQLLNDKETIASLGIPINTNIRAEYGKRLPWSREKVVRDIMQNFMDGHNGTIEDVKFDFAHNSERKSYKIRISGKGEYNHKEIEDLGAGTKYMDEKKAGGFGEGAKMASIKLLADYDTSYVKFGSRNWELKFNILKNEGMDLDYLYRTLTKTSDVPGNFIEFETKDKKLIDEILNGTNYVYHPGNRDFQLPIFENEHFGLEYLGKNKKGNLYIANQRFEFGDTDKWNNNLEGFNLFFKRKPQSGIVNTGRDRTHISSYDISSLIKKDFAKTMSDDELTETILKLRDTWNASSLDDASKVIEGFLSEAKDRKLGFKFPDDTKYYASDVFLGFDQQEEITKDGYILCNREFSKLGMPSVSTLVENRNALYPLRPNFSQIKKTQILDEASRIVVESMRKKNRTFHGKEFFLSEEANRPTYFYDRNETDACKKVLATAITTEVNGSKIYDGQWMDVNHIKDSFSEVFATRLHEMCHKFGGDETKDFSYALTSLMGHLNEIYLKCEDECNRLKCLSKLWDKVGNQ